MECLYVNNYLLLIFSEGFNPFIQQKELDRTEYISLFCVSVHQQLHFTWLFVSRLFSGVFPSTLKQSFIVLVFKFGSKIHVKTVGWCSSLHLVRYLRGSLWIITMSIFTTTWIHALSLYNDKSSTVHQNVRAFNKVIIGSWLSNCNL